MSSCGCGGSCSCGVVIPQKGAKGDKGRGYDAQSSTSITIGTGNISFTMTVDKAYVKGSRFRMASASDPQNEWQEGIILSYNPLTGAATAVIDLTSGSVTDTNWYISIAGEQGQQGVASAPTLIYSNVVPVACAAMSGTQTVDTYSLAGGTLATDGDFVELEFMVKTDGIESLPTPVIINTTINGVDMGVYPYVASSVGRYGQVKVKLIRYDATNFSSNLSWTQSFSPNQGWAGIISNTSLSGNWSSNLDIVVEIQRPFGATSADEFYIEDITIKQFIQ